MALDPASTELQTALYRVKSKKQGQEVARQAKKIRVRQIVVRNQPEADEILAQLKAGEDFAELARTKSIDLSGSNGGDLGYFGPGEMLPVFEETAMNLQVGEVSTVIQTSMGFHIINVSIRDTISCMSTRRDIKDKIKWKTSLLSVVGHLGKRQPSMLRAPTWHRLYLQDGCLVVSSL